MSKDLHYLDHLATESARFAEALSGTPPDAAVPSCPEWSADDLLWHLAEVQWFWGTIVRERLSEPSQTEEVRPGRPTDRSGLVAFYERVSQELGQALAAAPPDTAVWTWSDEQTVGFVRRRQAHEALIHRLDAELVAASRTPMDRDLSADGVDEVLRIMYGGAPPWGSFTADEAATLRLEATDTGDSWFVTLGRFTGVDPDEGSHHDEPDLRVADTDAGADAAATLSGDAADLDSWLWHRPTVGRVERLGDQLALSRFDCTIADGID